MNNKLDWVKDLEHHIRNLKANFLNYEDFSINPLQKDYLKKAENYAYLTMSNSDLHGIGHVVRVIINIRLILKNEIADPFLTFFSGWLHDIGRAKEFELNKHHAVISADMTKQFITSNNIELSQKEIEHIIECIMCHSYSACLSLNISSLCLDEHSSLVPNIIGKLTLSKIFESLNGPLMGFGGIR